MDPESGEEHELPIANFAGGEKALAYYNEETPIKLTMVGDQVLRAAGPQFVIDTVKSLDETKGSANAEHRLATSNAVLSSGGSVVVPRFIKVGERIRVDVFERKFVGREK